MDSKSIENFESILIILALAFDIVTRKNKKKQKKKDFVVAKKKKKV